MKYFSVLKGYFTQTKKKTFVIIYSPSNFFCWTQNVDGKSWCIYKQTSL